MEITAIRAHLEGLKDPHLAQFSSGLLPGLTRPILGVRTPQLRTFAKTLAKTDWRDTLTELTADTYEELRRVKSDLHLSAVLFLKLTIGRCAILFAIPSNPFADMDLRAGSLYCHIYAPLSFMSSVLELLWGFLIMSRPTILMLSWLRFLHCVLWDITAQWPPAGLCVNVL